MTSGKSLNLSGLCLVPQPPWSRSLRVAGRGQSSFYPGSPKTRQSVRRCLEGEFKRKEPGKRVLVQGPREQVVQAARGQVSRVQGPLEEICPEGLAHCLLKRPQFARWVMRRASSPARGPASGRGTTGAPAFYSYIYSCTLPLPNQVRPTFFLLQEVFLDAQTGFGPLWAPLSQFEHLVSLHRPSVCQSLP